MRYAILSDVHSNLQAWNAVLLDIRSVGVDRIICLGDIVGYGPNPVQVLESVYAGVDHFVLGNHDAVICGKLDDSLFNDSARSVLEWTKDQVGRNARQFLSKLPLALDGVTFRCAHAEFSEPGYFNYITEPQDALPSWNAVKEQLLFVGHTHVPAIFLLGRSGTPHVVPAQDFAIEQEKRYLVNTGSVGQPRDGDARASYCVYDQEAGTVCWRRIPFDIDAYRNAVIAAGISLSASYFLDHDPRKRVRPLREMLSFSPAKSPDKAAQNVVAVHTLEVLQKRVRKWKLLFALAAVLLLVLLLGVSWAWVRNAGRQVTIGDTAPVAPTSAASFAEDTNMLSLPPGEIPAGQVIPGWTLSLLNRHGQQASIETVGTDKAPSLVLKSDGNELRLSSQCFNAKPNMKFHMEALFKPAPGFKGDVFIWIELTRRTPDGEQTNHINQKAPSLKRKDGWLLATSTFTLPAGSESIRFEIYGKFRGRLQITDIQLMRKRPSVSEEGGSN